MGPSCPYFHWHTWAPRGLDRGLRGSPAGWRSSKGGAAPWRCTGGKGHSQSWQILSAGQEPLVWRRPVSETGSFQVRRIGCCRRRPRWMTERTTQRTTLAVQKSFCCLLVGVWCHCNICYTSSMLCGVSSLLWCMLEGSVGDLSETYLGILYTMQSSDFFFFCSLPDSSCFMKDRTAR